MNKKAENVESSSEESTSSIISGRREYYINLIKKTLRESSKGLTRDYLIHLEGPFNTRKLESAFRALITKGEVRRDLDDELFYYVPTARVNQRFAPTIDELMNAQKEEKRKGKGIKIKSEPKKPKLALAATQVPMIDIDPNPVVRVMTSSSLSLQSRSFSPTFFPPTTEPASEKVKLPSYTELLQSIGQPTHFLPAVSNPTYSVISQAYGPLWSPAVYRPK